MDKTEVWAIIKYLEKKGMKPNEIHDDMVQTLVDVSPYNTTVKKSVVKFSLDDRRFAVEQIANWDFGDKQDVCMMGPKNIDTRAEAETVLTFSEHFLLASKMILRISTAD